jgi:peptide/nickel transport system permease protein
MPEMSRGEAARTNPEQPVVGRAEGERPDALPPRVGGSGPAWLGARVRALADFWRVFRRNRAALVALYALVLVVLGTPAVVVLLAVQPEELSADVLTAPSRSHPMGTDYLGRDVLGRVLHGVNTSLVVGTSVALLGVSIGIVLGSLAGYYGSWVDHAIMRAADALLIVPTFFLVLSIAFLFGGRLLFVVVLLGITTWPQIARIVRAEVLALREEAFVVSARALGVGDAKLMFKEILPNTLPPVIAMIALLASSGILTEASLSFLGVGDPNVVSLGQMLTSGLEYATSAWWVPAFPGGAIFVLVLLLNVLGDGLNVALNPRLRTLG